jgi:hypothetical protein
LQLTSLSIANYYTKSAQEKCHNVPYSPKKCLTDGYTPDIIIGEIFKGGKAKTPADPHG